MDEKDLYQFRATFKDTKNAQKKLRSKLDELIQDNRPVTKKERDELIETIADAFLGLCNKPYRLRIPGEKTILIDNLGGFFREALYFDNNKITNIGDGEIKLDKPIEIKDLWEWIRRKSLNNFDEALAASHRTSKEREVVASGSGTSIDEI